MDEFYSHSTPHLETFYRFDGMNVQFFEMAGDGKEFSCGTFVDHGFTHESMRSITSGEYILQHARFVARVHAYLLKPIF